jgi:phosphonate transport system substrate-binding protein
MTPKYRFRLLFQTVTIFSVLLIAANHDSAAQSAPTPTPYTFGVFPHLSSGQIEKLFAPFAAHLSQELGRRVYLRTKPSFAGFTAELAHQTYDLAFVQPFDYVAAHDKYGYVPVVRSIDSLSAILVVRPDSVLRSLQDLKGKKIGLPPRVAAVSFLTRKALLDAGMNINKDVSLQYFKAHDACLNQLLLRKVDVCGSAEHPIRYFQNKWHVTFRKLATTKTIPPALFMVHSRIPPQARQAIKRAILSWQDTKHGRTMLQSNGFQQFQSTDGAEYKIMQDYSGDKARN